MAKRWLARVGIAAAMSFGVVGCGSETGNANNSAGGGSTGGGQVTIQFEHWRGEDVDTFNKIIQQFEQKYPNIKVQQTALPSQDYMTQLQTTMQGGNGPDVFATFPGPQFNTLFKSDVYLDLTNEPFVQRFQPNLIQAGQMNGKQYALPWQLVYNDPIYNMDIFQKYNLTPPKTWSGFLQMCQTLKDHGVVPIAWDGQISNTQFINPMLMNNMPSVDIFDKVEAGQAKLTDPWYTKTLSQIKELYDKGYFQKNPNGTSSQGAVALFASGKAAMLAMGSYDMANSEKLNPNLHIGVLAPITTDNGNPKYEGIYTATFMLGINKNSKHIDAAKKFLDFLTQPDIASEYANGTGQFVTEKDITYTSKDLQYLAQNWLTKQDLVFQPRYTIKNPQVQKAVDTSVQNVMGGMSVAQAAEQAQKEVDQAIKK
ncbi:ABC transporter substrate-binding protein [Alicyclobacillus macrosporangiidus]|uniref:ABC transporter substrate-binding protein n=1 Tax=Alicyclobacillus macrosporangiidus TaxID=392015 RepID=UPI0004970C33|nr:sugar ABC transporter substrate-binding protein [Alicyclobacillus macrosporangiidus]